MDKLLNFFEELSMKNRVIIALVFIVFMIIITAIRNYSKKEVTYGKSIDYKNISVEQLLENFNEDYSDRDDYLVISNIINELKKNSDDSGKYYEALDYYYSKRISKSKFKNG